MTESPCKKTNGRSCPTCSGKMETGRLQTAGHGVSSVYIEIDGLEYDQMGHVPICVWFCRKCGQVLLFADVSEKDTLGDESPS